MSVRQGVACQVDWSKAGGVVRKSDMTIWKMRGLMCKVKAFGRAEQGNHLIKWSLRRCAGEAGQERN